jgi:hypothetical protein
LTLMCRYLALGLSLFAAAFSALSQEAARKNSSESSAAGGSAAPTRPAELRRPGFLFVELGTPRVSDYAAFFEDVAGFRVIRKEARYAEMTSELGEILLIDPQELPRGHPFHGRLTGSGQGLGVEIGLVVGDLDRAYAAAVKHEGFRISTAITRRPWGVRDFRVLAPDGYYLRFTEGPKAP